MKKPTSKSASVTPKASSPSGTSSKTVGTAKRPRSQPTGKFAFILDVIAKRTPEETLQALIRAGIYNEDGTLTPHYQPRPKAKNKPAKGSG